MTEDKTTKTTTFFERLRQTWRKYDEGLIFAFLFLTILFYILATTFPPLGALVDLRNLYPYFTFVLIFLVFSTLVVRFSSFENTIEHKIRSELSGTPSPAGKPRIYRDVLDAVQSLASDLNQAERIDIFTYTSETLDFSLRRLDALAARRIRLLIRNPAANYLIPDSPEWESNRKAFIRKECIPDWKELMEKYGVDEWEIRGYDFEPQMKAMIIDRKLGFMGYYQIFQNHFESDQGEDSISFDYQGKAQPLIKVSESNPSEDVLITGFLSWYDAVWENLSTRLKSNH